MKKPDIKLVGILRGFALVSVTIACLLGIFGCTVISPGDDPPQSFADAGPDRNIDGNAYVTLDGTGSQTPLSATPGNAIIGYFWEIVSEPPGEIPGFSPYSFTRDQNRIRAILHVNTAGEYVARLRVQYRDLVAFDTVTLTAYNGLIPPNSEAGPDQFVKHGAMVTLDGSSSEELENISVGGERMTYQWFIADQPDGTNPILSANDVVNPSFIAEFNPDASGYHPHHSRYRVRLHTIDATQRVSDPTHVNVFVFPPEGYVYPMPIAGPEQRVLTGSTVNLDGSGSYDVDGRPLTYDWEFYSRPTGSNVALTNADTATPSFVADADGVYVVQLMVSNGRLSSVRGSDFRSGGITEETDYVGVDRVVVIANSENSWPVPDAGPDLILPYTGPEAIPLDGSGSYDADGHTITYNWLLVDTPESSGASIDNPFVYVPDSASLLADLEGTYVIGLNALGFEEEFDQALITLTTNTAPNADAGPDQAVMAGATVNLDGSVSSDPDGDPLGYNWSMVSAPDTWGWEDGTWHDWPSLSDARIAIPSFTTTQNGSYVLRLTVNDSQFNSAADEVTITVTGGTGGDCPNPLNLVTALPFAPGVGEVATNIQIDGDDLIVVAGGAPLGIDVMQANIPNGINFDQADFVVIGSDWEEISRTHTNPISDSDSPSFVIRQTVDDIYYKLDFEFTGDAGFLEVQIDELTGCRCGNDPGNCPP